MKTLTFYKVVFLDSSGHIEEHDFPSLEAAQSYVTAFSISDAHIYKYRIIGDCEQIV